MRIVIWRCWLAPFPFWLRPRLSSWFQLAYAWIILSRTNFVCLLTLEILDGRLIKLELITLVLVIAVSVDIGGNGGYGLILVDVDEMLQYFWLGCGISAHHLWAYFEPFEVAA